MPVTITGFLNTAQGVALAGALVTCFPLNAPLPDAADATSIITSALVRTRTAANGSFSLALVGGSVPKPVKYRVEFAEVDRLKLEVTVSSGTIHIGTIVIP